MRWFWNRKNKKEKPSPVALAKRGDIVHINYSHIEDVIKCHVENNDPEDKKIFLALNYNKEKHSCLSKEVIRYDDARLRNFKVLNLYQPVKTETKQVEDLLANELEVAISEERYERAEKLKKAIEILKG